MEHGDSRGFRRVQYVSSSKWTVKQAGKVSGNRGRQPLTITWKLKNEKTNNESYLTDTLSKDWNNKSLSTIDYSHATGQAYSHRFH